MAALDHFTEANFSTEVLDSSIPVLVYFKSPVCAPCKMVTPVVEQLAAEWGNHVKVGTLDIYESFKLTLRYTVLKAPTLMLFVQGKAVERVVGFVPKEKLLVKLQPHLLLSIPVQICHQV